VTSLSEPGYGSPAPASPCKTRLIRYHRIDDVDDAPVERLATGGVWRYRVGIAVTESL